MGGTSCTRSNFSTCSRLAPSSVLGTGNRGTARSSQVLQFERCLISQGQPDGRGHLRARDRSRGARDRAVGGVDGPLRGDGAARRRPGALRRQGSPHGRRERPWRDRPRVDRPRGDRPAGRRPPPHRPRRDTPARSRLGAERDPRCLGSRSPRRPRPRPICRFIATSEGCRPTSCRCR